MPSSAAFFHNASQEIVNELVTAVLATSYGANKSATNQFLQTTPSSNEVPKTGGMALSTNSGNLAPFREDSQDALLVLRQTSAAKAEKLFFNERANSFWTPREWIYKIREKVRLKFRSPQT